MIEPKATLFDIVKQAQSIEQAIAEAGGEISPELELILTNMDLTLSAKVDGYAQIMDRLDAVSEYWKSKAKELSLVGRGIDNAIFKIKDRLKNAMIEMRKDEVYGESIRFKLTVTKGALVIEDSSKIPPEFMMTVTTLVPDKDRIREALERLDIVPGAKLEGGYSLRKYLNRESKR